MKTKLLLCSIFVFQLTFSQTSVPGGIVNGTWNLAGSPYNIQGSIQIVNGDSLIIQPGVTVNFQGTYKLLVLGKLIAIGTATDTITFTAANSTTGWRGIRFDNTPSTNDTSRIMYCKVQYGNATGSYAPDQVGGGIYLMNFSKALISNSTIANCRADNSGGGIYCTNSSPIIVNNTISNNSTGMGGGIYCDGGSLSITNNTISYNSAVHGAGILCSTGTPNISNNIISYNTANGEGGGIYCAGANPTIINNTITFNIADGGGGIHSYGATISNNTISNNYAKFGGGIECAVNPIIINNIISDNTANETSYSLYHGGGGIYSEGNPTIMDNTISNNNSGTSGGGIKFSPFLGPNKDTTILTNNHISNNTSANFGGGINISSEFTNDSDTMNIFIVTNNTITNNKVAAPTGGGGAIYNSYVERLNVTNNTITNNSASMGGALYCLNSSPTFINCILHGNTDSISGPQVFLYDEPSDPSFFYCDIEGGSAAFELNGNFYTGTYQNNLDIDPLFVSPSGGSGTGFDGLSADWSLQAGSPCIDTGDPNGTYPAADIAGNPRVAGSLIDIGAYEFPLVTGIANIKNNSEINFYPNPSSGKFTFHSSNGNTSQIEIFNVLGEKIYNIPLTPLSNWRRAGAEVAAEFEVDLTGCPKGIYFAKLILITSQGKEKKNLTEKILIQ